MDMENHKQLLSAVDLPSVSLGYTTVKIYPADELKEAQIGYSVDPTGNSLIDEKDEGSWKQEWLVIGYEDLCGDPIFMDTASEGYPVYTAGHGEGAWRAKRIATTLKSFAQAMREVSTIAKGRETANELETNPIGAEEKADFLARIEKENPDIDLEFWELWLGE
jgi:hypothetical protein